MEAFFIILYLQYLLQNIQNPLVHASPLIGENVVRADVDEFPFIVSLGHANNELSRKHFCGGSLISKRHVLTAAHCLDDINAPSAMEVNVGTNILSNGTKYAVKKWLTYKRWANENNVSVEADELNDIAVITLASSVRNIAYAKITRRKTDEIAGNIAVTAGWGLMRLNIRPNFLQKVSLRVMSKSECEQNMKDLDYDIVDVKSDEICTNGEPPAILGCGDSGGPLLINNNEIIGINSLTCPTDITHPKALNVHVKVYNYHLFIRQAMRR